MENIEFISAKDLPTTEAEEVDVLCVENGELKRKAGATLGGGAGGYVIAVTKDDVVSNDDGIELSINYDDFADILYKGGTVWLDLTFMIGEFSRCAASGWGYANGALQIQSIFNMGSSIQSVNFLFPNGTWTPPTV